MDCFSLSIAMLPFKLLSPLIDERWVERDSLLGDRKLFNPDIEYQSDMDPYLSNHQRLNEQMKYSTNIYNSLNTYLNILHQTNLNLVTWVEISLWGFVLVMLMMEMCLMLILRFLTMRENNPCAGIRRKYSGLWLIEILINLLAGMKLAVSWVGWRDDTKV